jgi:large subunit ribosomal protein L25
MTITLNAEKRVRIGKIRALRNDGFLPAIYYGRKEISTPIQIKKSDFVKVWKSAGESTVVKLVLAGNEIDALINEVDLDPVTGEPRHVDFYVFEKGHKVEISVPLEFTGISPAIKDLGGVLVKVMYEIKVKAEPSNLPHSINVDISKLDVLESHISAGELTLPKGVELAENADEVVVSVNAPKEEKEEAPVDLTQIEVEKKGKQEEEGVEATSSE